VKAVLIARNNEYQSSPSHIHLSPTVSSKCTVMLVSESCPRRVDVIESFSGCCLFLEKIVPFYR
jgi:hypothetical protein